MVPFFEQIRCHAPKGAFLLTLCESGKSLKVRMDPQFSTVNFSKKLMAWLVELGETWVKNSTKRRTNGALVTISK